MTAKYLDESLKKIEYTFRWTGMNLESAKKTRAQNRAVMIRYVLLNILFIISDVMGAIWYFIKGALKGDSLTTLTYIAPCVTLTILAQLKSVFFLVYDKQVNQLLSTLRTLEMQNISSSNRHQKSERIVKEEIDFLNTVLKVLDRFNWTLIISFPLMPMFLIVKTYMTTGKLVLQLPLLIEYPFDAFSIKTWPFIYLRQIYSTMLVVLQVCGADYLFYLCCTYIRIQFRLLKHDMEKLIPSMEVNNIYKNNESFHAEFVKLVKWHQEIIKCVNWLEVIYSKSTLFNFVSSSALICLTGFNVTTINDTAFIISFLSFLLMCLLQIFSYCFFGDQLKRASAQVSDGVYNSNWYLAESFVARQLYIIQVRAHTPCALTAYGFAEVNLNAFTKILSTAWSYFALLQTVYRSSR